MYDDSLYPINLLLALVQASYDRFDATTYRYASTTQLLYMSISMLLCIWVKLHNLGAFRCKHILSVMNIHVTCERNFDFL